jgi:prepilin-type N-terminal cleavage/methylation domain-containing protein/prepilin-type processing-associated H-X9-DG protein
LRTRTMTDCPAFRPHVASKAPRHKAGFNLVELIVVLAIIVLLAVLVLPSMRSARPAARRTQCKNNLKQIVLALHNYRDTYHTFPPAYTVDSRGKRMHSWRTLILPFLEGKALYDKIDLSKPWDDPANAVARSSSFMPYVCPDAECPPNQTTYLAVVAPNSCLQPGKPRDLPDISGELGNKLLVVEVDSPHAVPWMAPNDADEALVLSLGPNSKLPHAGGFMATFVDGHVLFLGADLPATDRRAMISIEGPNKLSADAGPVRPSND